MGIPLWESSPTKSLDKSLASSRCNTSSSRDEESEEWTTNPPRSGSSSTSLATSTSTSSATSTGTSMATVIALTARDEPTPRSRRDGSSSTDNSMLTLDEFLRETSQASAASNEAERHLQTLLLAHRRSDRDRPGSEDWRRSLFDHTSSASARLRLTSSGTASLSPPSPTGNDRPGIDSFDTLVSQIRRIGALQDAMLSTVDDTTASLEDSTINRTSGGGTTVEGERRRSAVDSLRVREARLRAMQTRIDLLASEFQLLRSTRRELRRVEQQALEIQDSRNGSRAGASEDGESQSLLPPERRTVRRAFLQQPETEPASSSSIRTNTSAENSEQPSPPTPVSIDRRSLTMTEDERVLMLRNTVMQMQIESLAAAGM